MRFIAKPNLEPTGTRLQSSHDRKARKLLISREITHATNFMGTRPEKRSALGGRRPSYTTQTYVFKRKKQQEKTRRGQCVYTVPSHATIFGVILHSILSTQQIYTFTNHKLTERCTASIKILYTKTLTVVEYG